MNDIEQLIENWLCSVNQPVVNSVEFLVEQALGDISDGGNFTPDECKQILIHFITTKP